MTIMRKSAFKVNPNLKLKRKKLSRLKRKAGSNFKQRSVRKISARLLMLPSRELRMSVVTTSSLVSVFLTDWSRKRNSEISKKRKTRRLACSNLTLMKKSKRRKRKSSKMMISLKSKLKLSSRRRHSLRKSKRKRKWKSLKLY